MLYSNSRPWTRVEQGEEESIWCESTDPTFVLKFPDTDGQTDFFKLDSARPSVTLRITGGLGVNVQLKSTLGSQRMIQVQNVAPGNVPFSFDNCCTELVMKIKQQGEQQCWLLNPGMALNYTWDNCIGSPFQVQWMVYGSEEEPFTLKTSAGKVLWGEEKVIHRVVRSRRSQTSSSDTESEGEDCTKESPVKKTFEKCRSLSSQNSMQNIVYRTKKSVYWITHGSENKDRFKVFFYTSRKMAARQLSSLMAMKRQSLLVCLHSLRLCFFDQGKHVGSMGMEPAGAQWFILVHGTWRYLGAELSTLIEAGLEKGDPTLQLQGLLKVDLKLMTTTSPLYAPLKRVHLPAVTASVKQQGDILTAKLALTRLHLETLSGRAVSILRPYLQLRCLDNHSWREIEEVELSVGGVNIRVENLQDSVLMKRMASSAVGRKWRKETLSFKKMKVGSMDVHLIGIDKRLPSIVKHSFLGYEHFRYVGSSKTGSNLDVFRTATLAVTLDAVLPVQVLGVLSKAFLSYEKLEKQEQICHKQEVWSPTRTIYHQ